jgi:hypothetical protein
MHGAVEMALGTSLMASPLFLAYGPAGTVLAILLGALLVGLALGASAEGDAMPVSAHFALDRALSVGLAGASLLLAIDGDQIAAVALIVTAVTVGLLSVTTRYSRRPA